MFKLILIIVVLVIGYVLFAGHEGEQIVEQKEQREEQIMVKQKQFMDQNKELGDQMQKDLEKRMQE